MERMKELEVHSFAKFWRDLFAVILRIILLDRSRKEKRLFCLDTIINCIACSNLLLKMDKTKWCACNVYQLIRHFLIEIKEIISADLPVPSQIFMNKLFNIELYRVSIIIDIPIIILFFDFFFRYERNSANCEFRCNLLKIFNCSVFRFQFLILMILFCLILYLATRTESRKTIKKIRKLENKTKTP